MDRWSVIGLLLFAAVLEAGGDAVVRLALHRGGQLERALFFAAGAIVLFAYSYTVNVPPWDFGRVLGLYIVFFFVVAQLISWLGFGHTPRTAVLAGGALIVCGGLVIALSESSG